MEPSPSLVVSVNTATVFNYTSQGGLKQACYIDVFIGGFIPRLKSRVFSAGLIKQVKKGT
jgi:hypothetical protein